MFTQPHERAYAHEIGITKREYFAAMILQGLCANTDLSFAYHLLEENPDDVAKRLRTVVKISDEMIKALNQQ